MLIGSFPSFSQIGYQVSLLNNATGEPRANESVKVSVKITDSEGNTICEQTKNETTNDFGILSVSVGNSDTFANVDWSKLPFFIEASVNNKLIGRSQLLSVPVAEYAKAYGTLTNEKLAGKYSYTDSYYGHNVIYEFKPDGTGIYTYKGPKGDDTYNFNYYIDGNNIAIILNSSYDNVKHGMYIEGIGIGIDGSLYK